MKQSGCNVPTWITNLRGVIDSRLYRALARLSDGTELDERDRKELLHLAGSVFRGR